MILRRICDRFWESFFSNFLINLAPLKISKMLLLQRVHVGKMGAQSSRILFDGGIQFPTNYTTWISKTIVLRISQCKTVFTLENFFRFPGETFIGIIN